MNDFANVVWWSKKTSLTRLSQLRRTIDLLLSLGDKQIAQINVDSPDALTVTDWVISQHTANFTTACIARPIPLNTLLNIAPTTLIEELIEGISP